MSALKAQQGPTRHDRSFHKVKAGQATQAEGRQDQGAENTVNREQRNNTIFSFLNCSEDLISNIQRYIHQDRHP
jgi:hypothetical protein